YTVLTLFAPLVIGRRGQRVLHLRIKQHDTQSWMVKGNIFMREIGAVQFNKPLLFAENAGKLIHQSAFNPHKFVFCGLPGEGQVQRREAQVKQLIEGKSGGTFQCSGRRKSGALRDVTAEYNVKTVQTMSAFDQLLRDA